MTIPNDPESEGIPDVADDDSTAYDDPGHYRFEDGPPMLPTDEAIGVDDYGLTAYEGSHDEPLQARLVREEHDFSADDPETAPIPLVVDEAVTDDMLEQAARDSDNFGEDDDDDLDLDEPPERFVGRIVELDEGGSFEHDEAESVAYDSREREGFTAEEAAMHEVPEDEVPYE